jgi:hypothetical protein
MLVKFCRLNRMLHWFAGTFDVRGIVFIIRHPCAVISSMLRWGEWSEDNLHGETRRAQLLHGGRLPAPLRDPFEPILESIETQVEVLATMWCLDHYVPLVHHAEQTGTHPWTLVSYERLLMHGRTEVERLANIFGEAVTSDMVEGLPEPSHSALEETKREGEEQLTKWTRHLSSRQVDDILGIVEEVGLSAVWTEEVTPDYDRLNEMQRPAARW